MMLSHHHHNHNHTSTNHLLHTAAVLVLLGTVCAAANTWVFRLAPGVDPAAFAAAHGLVLKGGVAELPRYYEYADAGNRTRRFAARSAGDWEWAAEQVPRVRVPRGAAQGQAATEAASHTEPTDPLYGEQWHLAVLGVPAVWATGNHGENVTVAVVDDGLQSGHADVAPNFCAACSHDFNAGKADPTPPRGWANAHGTRAGGVAAARDNAVCGVGVAYRARLAGIRLIAAETTDALEARALAHAAQANDVYSCSWGPTDDARRLEGPGPLLRAALARTVRTGRGGRGAVYVWAAGNGRAAGDSCNYDGYANSRYTLAVGAVGADRRAAPYSEGCAALMAVAPSSAAGQRGLPTIDLDTTTSGGTGGGGTPQRCYASFGGTSAAAPAVAGVVALVLAANPALSWRDVQHIVVASADPVAPDDAGWTTVCARHPATGRALRHANQYGFGLVNASAAVALARRWAPVAPAVAWSSGVVPVHQPVPDGAPAGVVSAVAVAAAIRVEWVEVVLHTAAARRGDLRVVLTSPAGTTSVLAEPHADPGADIPSWTFTSFVAALPLPTHCALSGFFLSSTH